MERERRQDTSGVHLFVIICFYGGKKARQKQK